MAAYAAASKEAGSSGRQEFQPRAMAIVVYFMNKTGYLVNCTKGKLTTAADVHETIMLARQLPALYRPVFAVWMTSPLLQVQLKPTQRPSRIKKQWKAMLAKFTTASVLDIEKDEPILTFQRNAFLPLEVEQKITNLEVLRLLYDEAVQNVVKHRYPMALNECLRLGAMQFIIENSPFDSQQHDLQFMKERIANYVPSHFRRLSWWKQLKTSSDSIDVQMAACLLMHCEEKLHETTDPTRLMKEYLAKCQKLDFYGAVFFDGQIEHERSILGRKPDRRVKVAINQTHLNIIDINKNEVVLVVCLEDMQWDYRPACRSGDHCFSSFFIEFDCEWLRCDQKICHQMQIFTRQAAMMDAMVHRCANKLGREEFDHMAAGMEAAAVEMAAAPQADGLKRGASIISRLIRKVKVDRLDDQGRPISLQPKSPKRGTATPQARPSDPQ